MILVVAICGGGSSYGDKRPRALAPQGATALGQAVAMKPANRRWLAAGRAPGVRMESGWYPARRAGVVRANVVESFAHKDGALRAEIAANPGATLIWDTIALGAGVSAVAVAKTGWDVHSKSVLVVTNRAELRRGNVSNRRSREAKGAVLFPKELLELDALDPHVLFEDAPPVVTKRAAADGDWPADYKVTFRSGVTAYARRVETTGRARMNGGPQSISHLEPGQVPWSLRIMPPLREGANEASD